MSKYVMFEDLEPRCQSTVLAFVGTLGAFTVDTMLGVLKIQGGSVTLGGNLVVLPEGVGGSGFVKYSELSSGVADFIDSCGMTDGNYRVPGDEDLNLRIAEGSVFYKGHRVLMPARL